MKVSDSPAFDAFTVLDKSYKDLTDNTSHTMSQHISSASTLSHVEQNNDLVIRLPAEVNNEIAVFSRSVNSLLEHFSKMISQVINASVEVGMSSADQIRIVESMVTGVRNQHLEIEQVATAVNEMSVTVLEVIQSKV